MASTKVYVLTNGWIVLGVYKGLPLAQMEGDKYAEQELTWHYDDAVHYWYSDKIKSGIELDEFYLRVFEMEIQHVPQ